MNPLSPSRDLNQLARHLKKTFAVQPPVGSIVGRTRIRDAVVLQRGCSQLQAEQLVDSMVELNLLVFEGDPGEPGVWHIRPRAEGS